MNPTRFLISLLSMACAATPGADASGMHPGVSSFPQMRPAPAEWSRPPRKVAPPRSITVQEPAAETGTLRFFGNLCYRNDWSENLRGFYHLDLDSPMSPCAELNNQYYANGGGTYLPRTNEYLTVSYYEYMGERYDFQIVFFDADTWQPTRVYDTSAAMAAYDMCYNPQDGLVYGCFAGSTSVANFAKFDPEKKEFTIIKALDNFYDAILCTGEGEIYGIEDATGKLNRISAADGTETYIGNVGLKPKFYQSATYDYKTRTAYWFAQTATTAGLYTVDLKTAKATRIADWTPTLDEWCGVFTKTQYAPDGAPEAVTGLCAAFAGAETTGSLSFTVPALQYGGTALTGNVDYNVTIDGEQSLTGNAAPGEDVKLSLTLGRGQHRFAVSCSNAAGEGPLTRLTTFVGHDIPCPPEGIAATRSDDGVRISWQAVTSGIHGGNLDFDNLSYTVRRLPDGKTIARGITGTSCTDTDIPSTRAMYRYEITACDNTETSEKGISPYLLMGDVPAAPYASDLNDPEHRLLYTTDDTNGDGFSWEPYNNGGETYFRYKNSHTGKGADDWLFTPSVRLREGMVYAFTPIMGTAASKETIEVKAGTAPAAGAMAQTVVERCVIDTDMHDAPDEARPYYFIPQADGDYHFGFHITSDESGFWFVVENWTIGEGMDGRIPGHASVLGTPAPMGALSASLEITLPETDALGNPLIESVDKLTVRNLNTGRTVATLQGADIKQTVTVTDNEPEEMTTNEYEIVCANSYGNGLKSTATVYVGLDSPAAPDNLRWTAEGADVRITWDTPTTGVHGGYVNPDEFTYGMIAHNPEVLVLKSNGPVNEFLDTPEVEEGTQAFIRYTVYARNGAGPGEDASTPNGPFGTPYTLPYTETFAGARITNGPWDFNETGADLDSATWAIGDTGFDTQYDDHTGDGGQLASVAKHGGQSTVMTPLVDLGDATAPLLSFWAVNSDDQAVTSCEVLVSTDNGMTWTLLGNVPRTPSGTWTKVEFPLAAFAGKTVTVGFRNKCVAASRDLSIDDVSITSGTGLNDTLATGNVTVTATRGNITVSGFYGTVEIYTPAGQKVASRTCNGTVGISLPAGIYIVRASDRRVKVAI